ncbi:MAG TPA: WhiB family transcriptional regulator [Actinomycetota bacterium]|nr:WhiB family transcriptional regulator [Actinomycetota bacterium]
MRTDTVRNLYETDDGWQSRAACRGRDATLFFSPATGELKEEKLAREARAKTICRECPVRTQCLEFALDTREPYGIWGGLNELERRRLMAKRAG